MKIAAFQDRVKWRMKELKIKQETLAKQCGVGQSAIANLLRLKRDGCTFTPTLARALQCDSVWLETGKGEWQTTGFTDRARELAASWDRLNAEQQANVWTAIASLVKVPVSDTQLESAAPDIQELKEIKKAVEKLSKLIEKK